jgi:hypothetical protein
MAPPKRPLQDLSRAALRHLVDQEAEDVRPVLKIKLKIPTGGREFFDVETVAVAVVEDEAIGPTSRQIVILKQGFRNENAVPRTKAVPPGETVAPRDFIQQGPFEEMRGGRRVTYLVRDGFRIEYQHTTVTRVVGPNGAELPHSEFRSFTIRPNEHHGEMRILDWAKRNKYRIVSVAPTRGCCRHCLEQLKQYCREQGVDIDEVVPRHRQTRSAWRSFLKESRRQAPASGAREIVAREDAAEVARVRNQLRASMAKFKTPDPRLVRVARYLKVAGPAMMAFDAATTYAKAAEQWHAGQKTAAAETVAELGGRMAGAFVGAEAGVLLFGGLGSVVPGLGTTVGALAGAVIGGAVGAALGEKGAKELCDQIIAWGKGAHPAEHQPAQPPRTQSAHRSSNAAIAELQNEMHAAGYGPAEIDFVGRVVGERIKSGAAATPKDVFQHLGSAVVDIGAPGGVDEMLAHYPDPAPAIDRIDPVPGPTQRTHPVAAPEQGPPGHPAHPPGKRPHGGAAHGQRPLDPERAPIRVTTEVVTGIVITPISGADQSAKTPAGTQDPSIADLSGQIEVLRQRINEYHPLVAGRSDFPLESQLAADLSELRRIEDQLRLQGASPLDLHAVHVSLNEVRNRYEQTADDARWAQDRKDELAKAREEAARRAAQEDARRGGRQGGSSDETNRRNEELSLRQAEEQRQKEERDRREEAERKDQQKRSEQAQEDARRKGEDDDRRRAEAARRQSEQDDARQQAEAARRQREQDDARQQAEAARRQREQDDARQAEAARRQREQDDARQQAEAARRQREQDEARRLADAARRQSEDEARRLADAARRQSEQDEARRLADAARRQSEEDERRRAHQPRRDRDDNPLANQHGRQPRAGDHQARRLHDSNASQADRDRRRQDADAGRRAREEEQARAEQERQRRQEAARRRHEEENRRRQAEQWTKQQEREQNEKARNLRQQEQNARRRAAEEERRRKEAEQQRRRDENERRRQQHLAEEHRRELERRRAEQDRLQREAKWAQEQRDRELRKAENEARRRAHEEERRRKEWERQRWREENDRRQRERDAERERRQREREARQREYEARQREREARQRERDARRNQPRYSKHVSGTLLGGGGRRGPFGGGGRRGPWR